MILKKIKNKIKIIKMKQKVKRKNEYGKMEEKKRQQ